MTNLLHRYRVKEGKGASDLGGEMLFWISSSNSQANSFCVTFPQGSFWTTIQVIFQTSPFPLPYSYTPAHLLDPKQR